MKVAVSEFKARCTRYLREIEQSRVALEITRNGKTIAFVVPPQEKGGVNPAWGGLKGTVCRIAEDFDEPLGEADWEAAR